MSIDVCLEEYRTLIEKHAAVALKKVKKPARYGVDDLVQEGMIVFLFTQKEFVDRGASFKTILIRRLRGHFATLVKNSYRNMEVSGVASFDTIKDDVKDATSVGKNNTIVDVFSLAQMAFAIEDLNSEEKTYVKAILFQGDKPKRSRRKAARKYLSISYERERKLRKSIQDKIRKQFEESR